MAKLFTSFDSEVVELLKNGAVGFMPSDTMYGLHATALDKNVVERVFKLKKRSARKQFIVLFSDYHQLSALGVDEEAVAPMRKYWPAPVTFETPALKAPDYLHRGNFVFGMRMPANHDLLDLLAQTGPLISTSANFQGEPPALDVMQAISYFGESLDFYINRGSVSNPPSTLLRAVDGKLEVLRQGVFKLT